ncbi:hypothetical protein CONLIGDRAFT_649704 [Coniochaeta ligniaria NRRL 30616]|uniref:Mid2 domain-containing protein n=1 Tax=Coniochaeta ligniaria NRRL 30616 TaxID=1408157 RepID=A0A1J7I7Q8_9PEZI|nr:hypothetical protein CONLIGDRAFT_649704 [Coniochaeta ligniaria NRRL 30616]
MISLSYVWAIGWLLHASATAQLFAAMNPAPTLWPRYYQAASPLRPLGKRQAAQCAAGKHACSDIGPPGAAACCPDDTYCIVNATASSVAACCAIGSVCNSPCAESEYQCIVTVTITSVSPPTTTSTAACCPRQCTQTSMFGCPSSLGGGCCSYGQTCASASQCLWTSSPTNAVTSVVSQIPPGCTTSQFACPSSLGGGCCDVTASCTFVPGSGAHCAALTVAPTASGVAAVPQNNDGLGTGAKAGIGAGVVAGVGIVVGVVTWLILRRRKNQRSSQGSRPDASGSDPQTYSGATATSPIPRRTGLALLARDRSPPEMTQQPHPDNTVTRGGGRLRGLTADYFGPAAVPGPFTEPPHQQGDGSPSTMATTPPGGNNRDRAVPMDPHSPDDITAPVEIDSRARQRNVSDTIAGRFELYGNELASPYSEGTSPHDVVSPYTPSPGTVGEGTLVPSPTRRHGSNG